MKVLSSILLVFMAMAFFIPAMADDSDTGNDKGPSDDKGYSCETRKTCSKVASCEEAYYQLKTCGNKKLDADNDGIPCEKICGGN